MTACWWNENMHVTGNYFFHVTAAAQLWQNVSWVWVCGIKRGMVRFLPPGLLCRWAWHTGLQSPDSQISSLLAQSSWAVNPLPPVSELRCSANDRGFKKKIKFDSADKTSHDYTAMAPLRASLLSLLTLYLTTVLCYAWHWFLSG